MTTAAGPLPSSIRGDQRSLAPDLARGAMLLLIALANTPWHLYGSAAGSSTVHPTDGSVLDRAVQLVIITVVDSRVYPMFAFLFGYGIVQLYRRQRERGSDEPTVRRVLRRRHLWMIAFGLLHAALLWYGDILGAYGLVGLILVAGFLRRRDTTLVVWLAVLTGLIVIGSLLAVVGASLVAQMPAPEAAFAGLGMITAINGIESWPASVPARLTFWPLLVLGQGLFTLVIPVAVLAAFWAARRGVLEHPEQHLTLLRRVAAIGLPVAWVVGLAHALDHLGVLPVPDSVSWVFSVLQGSSGLAGGLGYVAVFGLLAARLRGHQPGPVVGAVTAVGKRSLSCYLAQSVLCAPLLAAWGLGLGAVLGSAATALFAVGVWLVTVAGAVLLERRGERGPAETLLRRLSYGRPSGRGAVAG
ncbi:DUF418 domain-containing protein [Desertihabitans brevis]|uniref:DUF418 domain-containing protein n=1 Tax=Desertihabitans brevis TaxID=2268447 RepID=A0A367YT58_9ACTN|nr:DUF418 domain-containing protein [Desertihabitans brevis]RCK69085.1 DUF418 domain-containing protein [Desertihabitans brevis]